MNEEFLPLVILIVLSNELIDFLLLIEQGPI